MKLLKSLSSANELSGDKYINFRPIISVKKALKCSTFLESKIKFFKTEFFL